MATTARGHIEQLPSGSFRVHVYAGTDPVTGKPRRLKQTCPDEASAAAALGKLLAQADGDHFPNREATLGQALGKYLEVADLEVSTREAHEGYIRRTIGPVLGEVKIRKLGADSLDSLYTALKKCSRLCRRLPRTEHHADGEHACDGRCGPLRDHRTTRPHACDSRCRPHACRPMKPATILRIHSIISSALDLAVRYDWADRNVAKNASPPHPRKREPDPPSPDQAARLLNLVWAEDEEFGLYLWTAFTTGARRGEVSALRENRFDFTRQQVRLARNYLVKQGQHIEKAPKDGEGRVLSLDLLTCELFQERFQRRRAEARALGVQVPEDAFAFSPDPAGREPWNPGHDDPPVPPVRPPGRHHQLAEGAPALLRHPAPGRGHRPEHRGRTPRPRRGLDDLEVLCPVHPPRRPGRRHRHPLPARRPPQEGTPPRAVPPASVGFRWRRPRSPRRGHRPASWA